MARFGGAEAAIAALPMLAARGGGKAPVVADAGQVAREIERVAALGARHMLIDDPDYPAILAELDNAPPALIVRGDASLLKRIGVAMVGARNASP